MARKKFYANLSQASTAAPTFTDVLQNSIGTPVAARSGAGIYTLTLAGAFPLGRTGLKIGRVNTGVSAIEHTSADVITIRTKTIANNTAGDDLLTSTIVEIDVYDNGE